MLQRSPVCTPCPPIETGLAIVVCLSKYLSPATTLPRRNRKDKQAAGQTSYHQRQINLDNICNDYALATRFVTWIGVARARRRVVNKLRIIIRPPCARLAQRCESCRLALKGF